jgi:hypothetical protein
MQDVLMETCRIAPFLLKTRNCLYKSTLFLKSQTAILLRKRTLFRVLRTSVRTQNHNGVAQVAIVRGLVTFANIVSIVCTTDYCKHMGLSAKLASSYTDYLPLITFFGLEQGIEK